MEIAESQAQAEAGRKQRRCNFGVPEPIFIPDASHPDFIVDAAVDMPGNCAVPQCRGAAAFKYPNDPEVRMAWMIAIGRREPDGSLFDPPTDNHRVCDRHFLSDDFAEIKVKAEGARDVRKLHPAAVPSVFNLETMLIPAKGRSKYGHDVPPPGTEGNNVSLKSAFLYFHFPSLQRCQIGSFQAISNTLGDHEVIEIVLPSCVR